MMNEIPDHTTMRKLAKRHMEDYEPKRWKGRLVDIASIISSILVIYGGFLLIYVFWLGSKYNLDLTVAMVVIGSGMVVVGGYIYLYVCFKDLKFNWVDYYFENVHNGGKKE